MISKEMARDMARACNRVGAQTEFTIKAEDLYVLASNYVPSRDVMFQELFKLPNADDIQDIVDKYRLDH